MFDSWAPYADLTTFTYHFGFHALAAVFAWLTGLTAPLAVLWTGQILNILAVLTVYLLAARISGSRWAGLIAVLIAGLLVPMPMTYLNWGRYTQLAGQAILPVAIYLAWNALEKENMDWPAYIPVWLAMGGLALAHYRVLIFGVLFFLAYLLLFTGRGTWRQNITRTFWIGLGGGVLFLPWFIQVFGGRVMQVLGAQLTTAPQSNSVWHQYNAIQFSELPFYLSVEMWVLLITSLGWAFLCRKKTTLLMGLWWGLIALAANPQWINLPGVGALSTFTVLIAAYIPAALLIGAAAGDIITPWMRETRPDKGISPSARPPASRISVGRGSLIFIVIICLGVYGTIRRQSDIDRDLGTLVTRPDLQAAAWIDATLPAASTFLVNQFFAFGDSVLVGSDAGWWLPLLSGRRTTLPPINYSWEVGPRPDYIDWVNELPRQIESKGLLSPDVKSLLQARGITHIYIGQRQGQVNYNGPRVLDPTALLADPDFNTVYHQNQVWIFEYKP